MKVKKVQIMHHFLTSFPQSLLLWLSGWCYFLNPWKDMENNSEWSLFWRNASSSIYSWNPQTCFLSMVKHNIPNCENKLSNIPNIQCKFSRWKVWKKHSILLQYSHWLKYDLLNKFLHCNGSWRESRETSLVAELLVKFVGEIKVIFKEYPVNNWLSPI